MQNNLSDLNNHLFTQLETLLDDELLRDEKKLDLEIKRSKAITQISPQILKTASVQVTALKVAGEHNFLNKEMPALLKTKDSQEEIEKQRKLLGAN